MSRAIIGDVRTFRLRKQHAYLERQKRELRKSLREMLDCYWASGDGDPAPEFIKRAARLSRWKAPEGSLEGTEGGSQRRREGREMQK